MRVCNVHGCGTIYPSEEGSRCIEHRRAARAARVDNAVYSSTGHRKRFRPGVLERDPICVICCLAEATVADHWPRSRKDLVEAGDDPNDPECGRGLCARCHNIMTANTPGQRGGWNDR